ncbi:MAG: PHP domain-containing protein [Candidatus Woesearchaeota archaeon]
MRYDLHTHTCYSTCSNTKPWDYLKTAKRKVDGIAVTDHNTIRGALKVKKLNKDKDFEIIVGEEIMTPAGEVLAYYVNEEIRPGPIEEVLEKAKEQGCITSIAHPFTSGIIRKSASIDFSKLRGKIDAIETFNGRMFTNLSNTRAKGFAQKHNFAQTGGSDAHFTWEIGRGWTVIKDSLKKDIKLKRTAVGGKIPIGIISRQLSLPIYLFNKLLKRS